jgi:bisphosphoglycerate-dependent phosphoglycerate mutase
LKIIVSASVTMVSPHCYSNTACNSRSTLQRFFKNSFNFQQVRYRAFARKTWKKAKHINESPGSEDVELVTEWRRSWFTQPPLLSDDDPRRLEELKRWRGIIAPENIPRGESLQMVTKQRVRPFLDEILTPTLDAMAREKRLQCRGATTYATGLVVDHANSLRALLGVLCEVEDDPRALSVLERLKIPTGM